MTGRGRDVDRQEDHRCLSVCHAWNLSVCPLVGLGFSQLVFPFGLKGGYGVPVSMKNVAGRKGRGMVGGQHG